MRTLNKLFAAFFLSVAVIAAMKAQPTVTMDIDPNAPIIKFDRDTVKYGVIAHNSDGWRMIKVFNNGKSPLIIQNLETECGCTTVEQDGKKTWTQEPIAPGKSGFIKVHYDTKRVGSFTKHVTVKSNASSAAKVFVISGEVLAEGVQPPKSKVQVRSKPIKSTPKKAIKAKTATP